MRFVANDEQRSIASANPCRPAGCGGTGPPAALRFLDDGPASVSSPRLAFGLVALPTRPTGLLPWAASLIVALLTGCATVPEKTGRFPGETWEAVSPESEGFDSAAIAKAASFVAENAGRDEAKELVIVHNGRLIWRGEAAQKAHGVWSVTKAFTTLCFGLLIDDGKLTMDTRAAEIVPALADSYSDVTLRHFASMTSGYRAVGDEPRGGYTHGPSQTPFTPSPAPLFAPGAKYAYWDSAMNEFAFVLTEVAGEPLEDLFTRRIAKPIGMSGWEWGNAGEIDGIKVNGGAGNNNWQIKISAIELARLGHLFLHRGNWNGQQLIAASFIDDSVSPLIPATMPLGHPESGFDGRGCYGLNWWSNGIGPAGRRKWPGAPEGTFSRSGYNNNDLFVVPEWNLVVVRLGLDEGSRAITDEVYGRFFSLLGDARGAD
jgi:CubicO group peptidase (beta-lactamase class C family)